MPPRYVYWTIILEGKPTAFRAHDREELLPTLRQLQARHPDVVMKWFARGRLWNSQEEERAASHESRGDRRPPSWRPGGRHEDPRERFKVPRAEKRQRFAAKLRRDHRDEPAHDDHGTRPPSQRSSSMGSRPTTNTSGGAARRFGKHSGHGFGRPPGPGTREGRFSGPGSSNRPADSFRGRGPAGRGQGSPGPGSRPKASWRKPGGGRRGGGGGPTR